MNTLRIHTTLLFILFITLGFGCKQAQSKDSIPMDMTAKILDTIPVVVEAPEEPEEVLTIPQNLSYIKGRFNPKMHPDFIEID